MCACNMFEKNTEAFIVSKGGTYKNHCTLKGSFHVLIVNVFLCTFFSRAPAGSGCLASCCGHLPCTKENPTHGSQSWPNLVLL